VASLKMQAVRRQRPEECPLGVVADAGAFDVGQDRAGGVEQDLAAFLVPLLGDVQVMLDAVGLQMPDTGSDDG
jgi:hypothetical protein